MRTVADGHCGVQIQLEVQDPTWRRSSRPWPQKASCANTNICCRIKQIQISGGQDSQEWSQETQPFKETQWQWVFIVKAMKGTIGIVMKNVCDEQMTIPEQSWCCRGQLKIFS